MSKKKKKKKIRLDEEPEVASDENTEAENVDAKIIDRGESKLIISGVEKLKSEKTKPREITVQPRIIQSIESVAFEGMDNEEKESQVVRLESRLEPDNDRVKLEQAKFEKLEEPPDKVEQQEQSWDGAKITAGWWITITGLSSAALLIAGLFLKHAYDGDSVTTQSVELAPIFPTDDPYAGSPQKWFRDNETAVKKQAVELLEKYATAKNNHERSALVRDPVAYLKNEEGWLGVFRPRAVDDEHCTWSISDNEESAYLMLLGKDAEFMPMRAFFIRGDDGKIRLDWHATVGWSAIPMKVIKENLEKRHALVEEQNLAYELAVRKAKQDSKEHQRELTEVPKPKLLAELYAESVTLRCLLTRRNEFYVGPYNGRNHSAFMLRSPDRLTYLWGYVERDSELDLNLRRLLDKP